MRLATLGISASIFAGCISLGLAGAIEPADKSESSPPHLPNSFEGRYQQHDLRLLCAPARETGQIHQGATQRWIF